MLLDGWEPAIALVVVLAALFIGLAFDSIGEVEALVVGLAFPLVALIGFGAGLREHRRVLLGAGVVVCLLALLSAEEQVTEVLFERSPISTVELRPDQTVTIDDAPTRLRVEVHGDLKSKSGDAAYRIDLARGDNDVQIKGHIARKRRRTRKGTRISKHLTDRHDVTLAGRGPVRASLMNIDKLVALPVSLEIRPAPVVGPLARWGLLGALIVAALIQAMTSRRGEAVQLAAAVGMVGVFSVFIATWYNPDSPLTFMVGALIVGGVVGGGAGWIAGRIATALFGQKTAPATDDTA